MGWVVSVTSRPRFTPGERTPCAHCRRGWMSPSAGLDTEARGKILLSLPGIKPRSPGRPVLGQTLYCLSFPALVIASYSGGLFKMDVYFHSNTQQTTVKCDQPLSKHSRTIPRRAIGPLARQNSTWQYSPSLNWHSVVPKPTSSPPTVTTHVLHRRPFNRTFCRNLSPRTLTAEWQITKPCL
jgi:hypothetical protein